MSPRKAVIITGNPRFISDNPAAAQFYRNLAEVIRQGGYTTTFDAGEPYTTPPPASLWVGHSRGADRLRFAPPDTRTLAVGSNLPGAINHPEDDVNTPFHLTGGAPPAAHYSLSPEMSQSILAAIRRPESRLRKILAKFRSRL